MTSIFDASITQNHQFIANNNIDNFSERILLSTITTILVKDSDWCSLLFSNLRIGSNSSKAEVYEIGIEVPTEMQSNSNLKKINAAGKMLPVINSDSEKKNMKEITIAKLTSDLVTNGLCPFFSVVYFSTDCTDTKLPPNSGYYFPSKRFAVTKEIANCLNLNDKEKNKFIKDINYGGQQKWEKNIKKAIDETGNNSCLYLLEEQVPIKSTILISEMAYSDLGQFFDANANVFDRSNYISIKNMITNILIAIRSLQELNIIHNDLHPGNILVLKNDISNIIPLIHDFGESEIINIEHINQRMIDFSRIMNDLKPLVPIEIKTSLDELSIFIENIVVKFEEDYEKNYEEENDVSTDIPTIITQAINKWKEIIS